MARGQAGAADNQRHLTNDIGAGALSDSKALESKLIPGYTSLMNTGYMNPEEEAAATTNEMGASTAPFGAANFSAANRAAATRNPADLTSQQDQLALEQGQTAGTAAATLQQQKMQNQEQGMYGLEGLNQDQLKLTEGMYGLGPSTLQARAAGQSGDQTALGYLNFATGQGKG